MKDHNRSTVEILWRVCLFLLWNVVTSLKWKKSYFTNSTIGLDYDKIIFETYFKKLNLFDEDELIDQKITLLSPRDLMFRILNCDMSAGEKCIKRYVQKPFLLKSIDKHRPENLQFKHRTHSIFTWKQKIWCGTVVVRDIEENIGTKRVFSKISSKSNWSSTFYFIDKGRMKCR